tara:strand:+ start:1103 stop:1297 length:195 start_codon:yes stop_codon:yes gene_type:complete
MAIKGTASKSASGASMSKYDVEVEARLQALEKAVEEIKSGAAQGDAAKIEKLVKVVKDELNVDV